MDTSMLHLHSIGVVSANKAMSSHEISVVPVEYRYSENEELLTNPTKDEVTFQSQDGKSESIKVHTDNSVTAVWFKRNTNRTTPPDVRRGDKVLIYRLGDSDKYFWEDMNSENVKRLETVAWSFNADPSGKTSGDHSNAYTFEVSTHNKTITITTSMANGEKAKFAIQINAGEGLIAVEDEKGNYVYLDSVNTDIKLQNANGTSFRLNKKNIEAIAPDSMFVKVQNLVNFQCTDFKLICQTAYVSSKTTTVDADKVTLNTPQTTCTGNLTARSISIGGAGAYDSGFAEIRGKAIFYDAVTFMAPVSFKEITNFTKVANFNGGTTGDRT